MCVQLAQELLLLKSVYLKELFVAGLVDDKEDNELQLLIEIKTKQLAFTAPPIPNTTLYDAVFQTAMFEGLSQAGKQQVVVQPACWHVQHTAWALSHWFAH